MRGTLLQEERPIRVALRADPIVQAHPDGTRTFLRQLMRELVTRYAERFAFTFFTTRGFDGGVLDDVLPPGNWRYVALNRDTWACRLDWLNGGYDVGRRIGVHDVYVSG